MAPVNTQRDEGPFSFFSSGLSRLQHAPAPQSGPPRPPLQIYLPVYNRSLMVGSSRPPSRISRRAAEIRASRPNIGRGYVLAQQQQDARPVLLLAPPPHSAPAAVSVMQQHPSALQSLSAQPALLASQNAGASRGSVNSGNNDVRERLLQAQRCAIANLPANCSQPIHVNIALAVMDRYDAAWPRPSIISRARSNAVRSQAASTSGHFGSNGMTMSSDQLSVSTSESNLSLLRRDSNGRVIGQPRAIVPQNQLSVQTLPYIDQSLRETIELAYEEFLSLNPNRRLLPVRTNNPIKMALVNDNFGTFQPQDIMFTKFWDFPAEIRTKIWKAALPGPRTIAIGDWSTGHDVAMPAFTLRHAGIKLPVSMVIPSPLLHTCVESRLICLGIYHLLNFSYPSRVKAIVTGITPSGVPITRPKTLFKHAYVDFNIDSIVVRRLPDLIFMCEKREDMAWKSKVKKLVIADGCWVMGWVQDVVAKVLREMANVTDLGFVTGEGKDRERYGAGDEAVRRRMEGFWSRDGRLVRPVLGFYMEGQVRDWIREIPADQVDAWMWYGRALI